MSLPRVLFFGGGIQTSALAVLISQGKVKVDQAIFSDTGGEKPETYWYMANITGPMLKKAGVELRIVKNEQPSYQPDLYGFLWRIRDLPSLQQRRCSDHFKIRVINRAVGRDVTAIIGFSVDEVNRADRSRHKHPEFPLIDMGLSALDCRYIIMGAGIPLPMKSSCFFCPFQKVTEWLWLKKKHRALFDRALALEARFHEKRPEHLNSYGLLRGAPLRNISAGDQAVMALETELSCWTGYCGQ